MFNEAYKVISEIIPSDAPHVAARTFRISVLSNLAMKQAEPSAQELFFKRAEAEGRYILKNCIIQDEEFFCEYGLVFFAQAVQLFINVKTGKKNNAQGDDKEKVQTLLKRAEKEFEMGTV